MIKYLPIIAVFLLFLGCATRVYIPENLSPAELIQRAQEAMDRNRFNVAAQHYQALLDRNRHNIDLVITAEYHIAFIYYRQGRYDLARAGFVAMLEHYDSPDAELLPQHFRRLAQIVLERIDEKENQRRPFRRR